MSLRASGATGSRARARRARTGLLVAVAVGISALFMAGLTAKAVVAHSSCSNSATVVNMAVSYDIAPAIEKIADSYNKLDDVAAGHCVQVQVSSGASATEASQIDGQTSMQGKTPFDAWIPDSSMWIDVARSRPVGAQVVQPTGADVAKSPLMLVTTQAIAAKTQIFTSQPSWGLLLPRNYGGPNADLGVTVDLPDPTGTSAGLATVVEVGRLLSAEFGTSPSERTAFARFGFSAQTLGDFDQPQALQAFVESTESLGTSAVTVASEQAVLAYDKASPKAPLAARYPTSVSSSLGSQELNYPYVITTTGRAEKQAAASFGKYLQTAYAQAVVRSYGFRSAANVPPMMPASFGLSDLQLQLASAPDAAQTVDSLQAWEKLGLGSRALVLIDVSPAMNQPDGLGTGSLEHELTQTALGGLALFPPSTQMGLWVIGKTSGVSQPYIPLVSVGSLTQDIGLINRRQQLEEIDATLSTSSNGTVALNDSILDAYKYMTKTYAADYTNAVIVMASGVDNAPGDISTAALLKQVQALHNSNKPIELFILEFGSASNLPALEQVAGATGGLAVQITDPVQIAKVFFAGVSQRLCDQGCAAP